MNKLTIEDVRQIIAQNDSQIESLTVDLKGIEFEIEYLRLVNQVLEDKLFNSQISENYGIE